ncbi:MAG: glutamine synthetase III [Spirochaetales bacterium]|nr:glutamine synthetase III [Spirochaetales bacterium]
MEKVDFTKTSLTEVYGCNAFNDSLMRERLPKSIYKEIKQVQLGKQELTPAAAEVVANAMKDWAIGKGATHFTHWFQPLTGLTAEKHDSFISPAPGGKVILEFSGKELIKGEPDASSFPSGGLRATFEARGYTAWDVNSAAFVREESSGATLYIPTAFISYTGEVLDKKVPLLRSMEAINKEALRILKVFGTPADKVFTTVGSEQEYFLVNRDLAEARPDLLLAGRTLFGCPSPKGQEMDDHYFGAIKEKAATFMRELNLELWKFGISAKTQHNEVAPNQFEIAPIFESSNVASDQNQLLMDTIKRVANRHGLSGLLHEKPFAGINGSGKHNNWSLCTDTGVNLLDPGDNPSENAQFLVFVMAVIKAVDIYAPLLRASTANAGNEHRLGANEAPPAIISIFLGDFLTRLFEKLSKGESIILDKGQKLEIGQTILPKLPKDLTDRNRTSPFAFTGNKFEFRMVGSSAAISTPNMILNTTVADVLSEFAGLLEKSDNLNKTVLEIVKTTYNEHSRVIFNGNGYAQEWVDEAEKRGLPNIKTTYEALNEYVKPYAVKLFKKYGVFTKVELESRRYVYLEKYCQQIAIEVKTSLEMAERFIYPAVVKYARGLAKTLKTVKETLGSAGYPVLEDKLKAIMENLSGLQAESDKLKSVLHEIHGKYGDDIGAEAKAYNQKAIPQMQSLRTFGDNLEALLPASDWPFPSYLDLLFRL